LVVCCCSVLPFIILSTSSLIYINPSFSQKISSTIDKINDGISYGEIAKQLQRTEGSIKTRLIIRALNLVEEDHSITLEDAAGRYKITVQDIQLYQANKRKRQFGRVVNYPVNLQMVYSLLLEINSKLTS
jgi:hypothetical protein